MKNARHIEQNKILFFIANTFYLGVPKNLFMLKLIVRKEPPAYLSFIMIIACCCYLLLLLITILTVVAVSATVKAEEVNNRGYHTHLQYPDTEQEGEPCQAGAHRCQCTHCRVPGYAGMLCNLQCAPHQGCKQTYTA